MIEIKPKYKNKIDLGRMDALVQEAIGLYDPESYTSISGENIWKLDEMSFVLLDNFEQMTNLHEEFFSFKLSYDFGQRGMGTFIKTLLSDLKRSGKKMTFLNLIKMVNRYLSLKKKRLKITEYTFYIPTRLEFELSKQEEEKLKNYVKKCFGIKIIKKLPLKVKKQLKKKALISLFGNRQIILEIKSKARDFQFSLDNDVNPNIDSLLGIVAFAHHYGRSSKKWGILSDVSITESPLDPENIFIILENGKLNYPKKIQEHNLEIKIINEKIITCVDKLIWNIHNKHIRGRFDMLLILLKLLDKQPKDLKKRSKDLLSLYFEAIVEKQLVMSFFKFWILAEKIVKMGGASKDDKIVSIIKQLTSVRYTKERINNLYEKRNNLVHEYEGKRIILEDRNLSKKLSESLLLFFLDPLIKLKNLSEFGFMLDNIFLDKNEIKIRESILRRLKKKKVNLQKST